VEEGLRREIRNPLEGVIGGIVLGGERFRERVRNRVQEIQGGSEIPALREMNRKTDVKGIVEKVSTFYRVPGERITQRGHPPHPGSQVAMYLTRKKTDLSLNEIAAFFGGRHYTAVSVAFRRVEAKRGQNPRFAQELSNIEREIS
jgi:chromosomal replication initiation ATPase DnaA